MAAAAAVVHVVSARLCDIISRQYHNINTTYITQRMYTVFRDVESYPIAQSKTIKTIDENATDVCTHDRVIIYSEVCARKYDESKQCTFIIHWTHGEITPLQHP